MQLSCATRKPSAQLSSPMFYNTISSSSPEVVIRGSINECWSLQEESPAVNVITILCRLGRRVIGKWECSNLGSSRCRVALAAATFFLSFCCVPLLLLLLLPPPPAAPPKSAPFVEGAEEANLPTWSSSSAGQPLLSSARSSPRLLLQLRFLADPFLIWWAGRCSPMVGILLMVRFRYREPFLFHWPLLSFHSGWWGGEPLEMLLALLEVAFPEEEEEPITAVESSILWRKDDGRLRHSVGEEGIRVQV